MYAPTPIRAALEEPHRFERLQQILASDEVSSRWSASRLVCEAFDLRDGRGRLRRSSCMAALAGLEKAGRISLPASTGALPRGRPRGLPHALPPPTDVPDRVDRVAGLSLVVVGSDGGRRIWNEMIAREHPLGAAYHAGCQVRYLIGSDHGWLGGAVFGSATRAQRARDEWIGWSREQRRAGVHLVIGLSRFLIRPMVHCHNLASRALGLCLRRVAADYEAAWGFCPVLVESYVGPEHSGASYKAAGWTRVGDTAGIGRRGGAVAAKSVFLRPLCGDWRVRLGAVAAPVAPLAPWAGLDGAVWAENEFGGALPGDARLSKRLVRSVAIQALSPSKTFFTAASGDQAAVTGYYRMIEHPDETAISAETILAAHRERIRRRLQGQSTVLLVQDGTELNFATHMGCEGLGKISRNKGSAGTLGLHMHTSLAVAADGVPLGVARIEFDGPEMGDGPEPDEADKPAGEAPDEAKSKTQRWVRGLRDSRELGRGLDGVRAIAVMDREGDAFEIFDEQRRFDGDIALLVRARHNRSLGKGKRKLLDRMRAQPARADVMVPVKASAGREARKASCAVRWATLAVPPPAEELAQFGPEPVRLSAVHVAESEAPADGAEPLEWLLLTTLPVGNREQALEVVGFYLLRWRIEDWHRILKTGCEVEKISHRTASRIQRAVAIKAVIAWRLAVFALLGTETPELDAGLLFSEHEIAILEDYARERRVQGPDNLGRAVLLLSMMGGYLNRKHDAPPGHQIVWEGYARLALGARVLERAQKFGSDSSVFRKLTSG